jgi:hypothetical protein
MAPNDYIVYSDATGKEYTETATSPIAVTIREDELTEAGYTIIRG